jgi:hypothetical protein
MAGNRMSWHQTMRVYNSGFRCASDTPPPARPGSPQAGLTAQPKYTPPPVVLPRPVAARQDFFLDRPIRLEPLGWATFLIYVPWLPQSVWLVDCPETQFGPFGGANQWPFDDEALWHIDWQTDEAGQRISYDRRKDGKELRFEAWVNGPAVEYRLSGRGLGPLDLASFCFKTFSPFFSSQERLTQNRLDDGRCVRSCDLPVSAESQVSLGWSVGDDLRPGAVVYRSFEGPAWMAFVGPAGVSGSGNGWPPCTHLRGPGRVVPDGETGGGRVVFGMGPIEDGAMLLDYADR